ncbi:hypothetical protein L0152_18495 [bacterium]|nr:hypothetical protein [bacterium]
MKSISSLSRRLFILGFLLLICFSQNLSIAGLDPILVGASGIVRQGNSLLIAADKVPGVYFQYDLQGEKGPRIPFLPQFLHCKIIPQANLSFDLEGINILADGRIVVLSEALYALISEKGIVAQYPESFTEFGGVGLEGVAVRPNPDESSNVAVVWEGGYPEPEKIPFQIKEAVRKIAFNPVILLSTIPKNETLQHIRNKDLTIVELQVARPEGKEPDAQRFRAPDLVWYKFPPQNDAGPDWGFIVLLSSLNRLEPAEYKYLWLQRFDMQGKPVGEPFDLKKILPDDLKPLNWEGLGWYEPGKSLVATYDNLTEESPEAYVIDLPKGW